MSNVSRRCKPVPAEVRQTADLLERRWQLSIIYAALSGALRFNDFADAVAGISPRMLSERLRDLEDEPEKVRAALEIHPVSDVREVLSLALEPAATHSVIAA